MKFLKPFKRLTKFGLTSFHLAEARCQFSSRVPLHSLPPPFLITPVGGFACRRRGNRFVPSLIQYPASSIQYLIILMIIWDFCLFFIHFDRNRPNNDLNITLQGFSLLIRGKPTPGITIHARHTFKFGPGKYF